MSALTITKPKLSIKVQTAATAAAIAGAVAVPQFFHVLGDMSGLGTALGETFLPMHLPIILVGLLAGPYAGAISGLFGPLVSHFLSGMPPIVMLPFMMIELFGYGLAAGLLRNIKLPTVCKVVIAQIAGRAVRAIAILIAFHGFHYEKVAVATIWKSIPAGIFGIVLQLALIPLIVYRVENLKKHE